MTAAKDEKSYDVDINSVILTETCEFSRDIPLNQIRMRRPLRNKNDLCPQRRNISAISPVPQQGQML